MSTRTKLSKSGGTAAKRTKPVSRARKASRKPSNSAPVAYSKPVGRVRVPSIISSRGCTHIRHTEYFAVAASAGTPYAVSSFSCNPGVPSIFPWLSSIATRYETYKFRELSFDYHTRAATSQVGTFGMVFDFDAQDRAPNTQIEALTYHDKSADAVWKEQTLRLDLSQGDRLPARYTRAGTPSSTTAYDLKTFDIGALHIFVDGVAASANLGLLEVNYAIDFYTPQSQDSIGGKVTCTTALDATHLVGSVFTPDPEAILPFTRTSTSVLTFVQPWEGVINIEIVGTVIAAAPTLGISADGAISALSNSLINAGATISTASTRVRAIRGTTLTPTSTATTITSVTYWLSNAGYLQTST